MKLKPGREIEKYGVNGDTVVFRYLREDDTESALNYINSLIEEKAYIALQTKQDLEQERKWVKDCLEKMDSGNSATVVVEVNGKFSGSSSISRSPLDANRHVCDIGIGISRHQRGKGIGTKLMGTLCRLGRDVLGCTIAKLSVYSKNDPAMSLYEKAGFREVGKIPNGANCYGEFADEIIMVKEL